MNGTQEETTEQPRPQVLSLNIREKSALYGAYMPFLSNGGIFIPTTVPYQLGDEVFILLSLIDDPTKLPISGRIAWVTPYRAQGNKTQGIGVQFNSNENGVTARKKIEELLGDELSKSTRPTHTM